MTKKTADVKAKTQKLKTNKPATQTKNPTKELHNAKNVKAEKKPIDLKKVYSDDLIEKSLEENKPETEYSDAIILCIIGAMFWIGIVFVLVFFC